MQIKAAIAARMQPPKGLKQRPGMPDASEVAPAELSGTAGGDVSCGASLENSLTISYKVKKLNIYLLAI